MNSLQFGVGLTAPMYPLSSLPEVHWIGLVNGHAVPGSSLFVQMPENIQILAYKWGSSIGFSDFGTQPQPTDFSAADGDQLYLQLDTAVGTFASSVPVRRIPPELTMGVPDQVLILGQDMTPVDLSTYVQGDALEFALSGDGLPPGLSLEGAILSGIPQNAILDWAVLISVSNSGGLVDIQFDVTVSATSTEPSITLHIQNGQIERYSLLTDQPDLGNWHWARFAANESQAVLDGSGEWVATPLEQGTTPVGGNGSDVIFSENGVSGTQYVLAVYQRIGIYNSDVITFPYIADNVAPNIETANVESSDRIQVQFDDVVINTADPSSWRVRVNGVDSVPESVNQLAGNAALTLILAPGSIGAGDVVELTYTPGLISDLAENPLTSYSSGLENTLGQNNVTFLLGTTTPSASAPAVLQKELAIDLSGRTQNAAVLVVLGSFCSSSSETSITSATLDGIAPVGQFFGQSTDGIMPRGVLVSYLIFPPRAYTTISDLVVTYDRSVFSIGAAVYDVTPTANHFLLNNHMNSIRSGSDVSGDVLDGDVVIAAQMVSGSSQGAWTGATLDFQEDTRSEEWFSVARATILADESPRIITKTDSGTSSTAAISFIMRAQQ